MSDSESWKRYTPGMATPAVQGGSEPQLSYNFAEQQAIYIPVSFIAE
jgi:hypothetical protein